MRKRRRRRRRRRKKKREGRRDGMHRRRDRGREMSDEKAEDGGEGSSGGRGVKCRGKKIKQANKINDEHRKEFVKEKREAICLQMISLAPS